MGIWLFGEFMRIIGLVEVVVVDGDGIVTGMVW